jgi:hypothetical protein
MGLSDRPAERHRQVAASFTEKVHGTQSWDAPSLVEGWTARDIVGPTSPSGCQASSRQVPASNWLAVPATTP